MTVPPIALEVPAAVRTLAAGRAATPVWSNEIGGTTWRFDGDPVTYLKIGPPHPEVEFAAETARLAWVGQYVPAPRVAGTGEINGLLWLETEALPGFGAVSGHFSPGGAGYRPPAEVATALGRALRQLHEALPAASCPWTWSIADSLALASTETREQFTPAPDLDLVVCHGDACNPNFLLDDDLACTGYVDLGHLGVADRWADIAPATMSLVWDFGDGLTDAFLEGYGIALDERKLAFYGRLWDADL